MVEFVVFCLPALIYIAVQSRGPEKSIHTACRRAGLRWGSAAGYGWTLALFIPLTLAAWLALTAVPPEVLAQPGVQIAQYTSIAAVLGVVLRAAGEEIFFRGLLAGVFIRRWGVGWGTTAQAVAFLLPHLPLLLIDLRLWPIITVQFLTGWALGWLRHRADSCVPGIGVHALGNIAVGVLAA